MKNIIYYFLLILVSLSCSKEDNEVQTPEQLIDVYRHQIVSFEYNGNSSNQETINGTIGGQNIVIAKGDDNKFNFSVPSNLPLGVNELSIPALNNFKSKYNVLDVTLTQTPEQELSNFTAITEDFFTSNPVNDNDDQIILDNYQNFKNYLENHATEDEKIQMAKFYKVNKDFIDNLILYDPENPTGRFTNQELAIIGKFSLSVLLAGGGAVVLVTIPEPVEILIALVAVKIGVKKAIFYHNQLRERSIKVVLFDIDNIFGINNRSVNNILQLNDDEAYTTTFNLVSTQISESDSSNSNSSLVSFFENRTTFNNMIDNLNDVINSLNSIIPFLNLSNLNHAELSNNPTNENILVTPEIMEDITFSINHPNLELVTASVSANNEFTLQVKIIGNPTQTTISSTLNYSYSDPMTTFSGYFDIEVEGQSNNVCGDVVDFDGNVYNSITIGTQCWMQQNLNVSHYRNGDIIPQVTDPTEWAAYTTGAWCYYANNTANGIIYGKLYNWYAVNDPRGLAPEGYHIPTESEWTELVNYLGGFNVSGGKLKATGTTYWFNPNTGATNESNFSALPSGARSSSSTAGFFNINLLVGYWSISNYNGNNDEIFTISLSNSSTEVSTYGQYKNQGYSIRCLKD